MWRACILLKRFSTIASRAMTNGMIVSFVFLTLLFSGRAFALDGVGLVGAGAESCGKFGELYKQNPKETEWVYFTWAQGYMSGANAGLTALSGDRKLFHDLSSIPLYQQMAELRAYCNKNPLADFSSAVVDLWLKFETVQSRN
jgi:hypothetical protein